jgi:hypothetical protein
MEVVLESFGQRTPDASRRTVRLQRRDGADGLYEVSIRGLPVADYRATLGLSGVTTAASTADFRVMDPLPELRETRMDEQALREACRLSGGRFYTSGEASRLLDDLPRERAGPLRHETPLPLWNHGWVLVVLFGLLGSEWFLRQRAGLP